MLQLVVGTPCGTSSVMVARAAVNRVAMVEASSEVSGRVRKVSRKLGSRHYVVAVYTESSRH